MQHSRMMQDIERRLRALRPRDRRALRLALWILLPTLGFVRVVHPFVASVTEAREQLDTERDLLARERDLLASARDFPLARRAALDRLERAGPQLLPGADAVTASAALVRYVTDAAAKHRVVVQTSQTRDAAPLDGDLLTVAVELRAVSDLEGIIDWVAALESGPRAVRINELAIHTSDPGNPENQPDEEIVGASLVVSGLAIRSDSLNGTLVAQGAP